MGRSLGGKSSLTSDTLILIYYICSFLGFFGGVSLLIPIFGAFISCYVANKEGSFIVAQHCTWIFRSIWISIVLFFITLVTLVILLAKEGVVLPEVTTTEDLIALWNNPAFRNSLYYLITMIASTLLIIIWFLYRNIRGIKALFNYEPIEQIKPKTL